MLFSLVICQWKATSLRIAAYAARRRKRERRCVLTKAAREGGGRSHRLLTVLDHGTYHQMVAGAVDAETVSAHRCWVEGRGGGGKSAEVKGGAQGRHGGHSRDGASRRAILCPSGTGVCDRNSGLVMRL